jgi:hypothetical protein
MIGQRAEELRNKVHYEEVKPGDALRQFRANVEACVDQASKVGVDSGIVNKIKSDVKRFVDDNTLEANEFRLALRVLFSAGNYDWTLALGIAVAQDLFILFLKLFTEMFSHQLQPRRESVPVGLLGVDVADRETDPDELRAAKAILRLHVPGRKGSTVKRDSPELRTLRPEISDNFNHQLKQWVRNGQAMWLKDDTCLVRDEVIADLEKAVAQYRTRQEQPPAPAESVPKPPPVQAAGGPGAFAGREHGESDTVITWPQAAQTVSPADEEQRASLDDYDAWQTDPPSALPAQESSLDETFNHVPENTKAQPFDFARSRRIRS